MAAGFREEPRQAEKPPRGSFTASRSRASARGPFRHVTTLRVPVDRDHRFRWKVITQTGIKPPTSPAVRYWNIARQRYYRP